MTFIKAVGDEGLAILAGLVMNREPTDTEVKLLGEAAKNAVAHIDLQEADALSKKMRNTSESHIRVDNAEKLSALIARAIARSKLANPQGEVSEKSRNWLSDNMRANSAQLVRVRAMWKFAAGLVNTLDTQNAEHALASAKAGATLDEPSVPPTPPPAPIPETDPVTDSSTEDSLMNPEPIREIILAKYAFNPAGLPAQLRDAHNQAVYVDAIVQAVALLGHDQDDDKEEAIQWSAAATALMLLDGNYKPQDCRFFQHVQKAVAELSSSSEDKSTIQIDGHFSEVMDQNNNPIPLGMTAPNRLTNQKITVAMATDTILRRRVGKKDKLFLQSFAVAARKAIETFPDHGGETTLMTPTVDAAYTSDLSSGGANGGSGIANVELPPLNDPDGFSDEIERENILAVSTIYVSYQLEFAIKACSRVLELFVAGLLPIPASDGSARELDNLYWDQDDLLDEAARRSIYARVLGAPGGELAFDVQPNSEFNTLLMRTVSAIAEYEREQSVLTHFDNAARGRRFQTTSGEFVRKAIRDFAANASLRGWAGTAFMAERMANQIRQVMKVLGLPAVRNAFGVSTAWQVVERVSQREFGITVNTVLHRTLAVETQRIMGVIANNHTVWSNTTGGLQLFTEPGNQGNLSDADGRSLVVAAQHFRAVTGIGDGMVDEYSQPIETQASPSLPDIGAITGGSGGSGVPAVDMNGINALRDLVNNGQTPSPDQILSMLPRL